MDDYKNNLLIREENLPEFLHIKDRQAPRINNKQVIGVLWNCKFIGRFSLHVDQPNARQYIEDHVGKLKTSEQNAVEVHLAISFDRIVACNKDKKSPVVDTDLLNVRYCTCNRLENLLLFVTRHQRSDYGEAYAFQTNTNMAIKNITRLLCKAVSDLQVKLEEDNRYCSSSNQLAPRRNWAKLDSNSSQLKSYLLSSNAATDTQSESTPRRRCCSASATNLTSKPKHVITILDEDNIECPPLPPRDSRNQLPKYSPRPQVKELAPTSEISQWTKTDHYLTSYLTEELPVPPPLPPRKISIEDAQSEINIQAPNYMSSRPTSSEGSDQASSCDGQDNRYQVGNHNDSNLNNQINSRIISDHLELNSWFKPNINRYQSEKNLLEQNDIGNFIIRKSTSDPENFALSVLAPAQSEDGNSVYHYKIIVIDNGRVSVKGFKTTFDNVVELVKYYTTTEKDLICALKP